MTVGGARIVTDGLSKTYGDQMAVDDVSIAVARGEFMTFLGPSGSGKTTTLNLIAGFVSPERGTIMIGDKDVGRLPAHKRNLGVVFQNYALFPHLTVAQNVAFPLKQRRMPRKSRDLKVKDALRTVHLEALASRRPSELSGGQQQRVALARAISFEPSVLLMDEPLGALDRGLREGMQSEIRRIHREVGSTVVFVTHDQEEAMALSDRIAVFDKGRIVQVGTGQELYERPSTLFIATFLGESTKFPGRVTKDSTGTFLEAGARLHIQTDRAVGSEVILVVRPERLKLRRPDTSTSTCNSLPVSIVEEIYLGSVRKLVVRMPDGSTGLVREPADASSGLHPGDEASLTWKVDDGVVVDRP